MSLSRRERLKRLHTAEASFESSSEESEEFDHNSSYSESEEDDRNITLIESETGTPEPFSEVSLVSDTTPKHTIRTQTQTHQDQLLDNLKIFEFDESTSQFQRRNSITAETFKSAVVLSPSPSPKSSHNHSLTSRARAPDQRLGVKRTQSSRSLDTSFGRRHSPVSEPPPKKVRRLVRRVIEEKPKSKPPQAPFSIFKKKQQPPVIEILQDKESDTPSRTPTPHRSRKKTCSKITTLRALETNLKPLATKVAATLASFSLNPERGKSTAKIPVPRMPHKLRAHQRFGFQWLCALHKSGANAILADDMGLGKTIQTITFLLWLTKQIRHDLPDGDYVSPTGRSQLNLPHLVVVPNSTIDNWKQELLKWAPSLAVLVYHGDRAERLQLTAEIRHRVLVSRHTHTRRMDQIEQEARSYVGKEDSGSKARIAELREDLDALQRLDVIVTTYTAAQEGLFRKISLGALVLDEAQHAASASSARHQALSKLSSRRRLLLTGTPIPAHLAGLVGLTCLLCRADSIQISKQVTRMEKEAHGTPALSGLASRIHGAVSPFVLRRLKQDVADLPPVKNVLVKVKPTRIQAALIQTLRAQFLKKEMPDLTDSNFEDDTKDRIRQFMGDTSLKNAVMQLRKAAQHPMLFRIRFTDSKLRKIALSLRKGSEWTKFLLDAGLTSNAQLQRGGSVSVSEVIEYMEIQSDFHLELLCLGYHSTRSLCLGNTALTDCGKIPRALKIIRETAPAQVLVFSHFTSVLDITQLCLERAGIPACRLDGNTPTDERQGMIDDFQGGKWRVFLISTKAGGVGITLTAASVVLLLDGGFNPTDEEQAIARAHRIGQSSDVSVYRLCLAGSLDEALVEVGSERALRNRVTLGDSGGEVEAMDDLRAIIERSYDSVVTAEDVECPLMSSEQQQETEVIDLSVTESITMSYE